MSFALDLSNRLTSHQAFHEIYNSLQRAAAVKTLSQTMTDLEPTLADDEVFKMLYCAGVFSQTESAKYRHLAQSIALSTLLLEHGCRVAFKSGTPRVERRMLPLNVTFRRQLVGVFPCFALQSGQLLQEAGAPFQTHEARQLLRTHLGQC